MVYMILGKGFEETEAIAPVDLMRRAGIEVMTAGIGGREIESAHGIKVIADCTVDEINEKELELIALPGGMGGVDSISKSAKTLKILKNAAENGKFVAAICAAPMVLASLGILNGKKATIYPGMENELRGAYPVAGKKTVKDGKVITGQGPGSAFDFGIAIVESLRGAEVAAAVKEQVHY